LIWAKKGKFAENFMQSRLKMVGNEGKWDILDRWELMECVIWAMNLRLKLAINFEVRI